MKTVYEILRDIAETSSTNGKLAIAAANKDNEELKETFRLAYSPFVQFYIRKIPDYTCDGSNTYTLEDAYVSLMQLSNRQVTGNAAIEFLRELLTGMSPNDASVLERVIGKDLKCGAGNSLTEKTWKGLIPTYPVLLCSPQSEKLLAKLPWKTGVVAQVKSDGARCNVVVQGNTVRVFSRNGKEINTLGRFDFLSVLEDCVIDGELLHNAANRQTGNGIVNRCIKGEPVKEETEGLRLVAWDLISLVDFDAGKGTVSGDVRLKQLEQVVAHFKNPALVLVEGKMVYSIEEAQTFYQEMIDRGEEGIICKHPKHIWEDKRSKDLVKFKAEETATLRCVGWEYGKAGTKNAKRLGNIICETSDGLLRVNVGTGFSDEQRDSIKEEDIVGKLVEVMYNQKILGKNNEKHSLFLPRFLDFRLDKDEADTLDHLV